MTHKVSIIGLGVMGQRMLTNMTDHDQFTVVVAWDPDSAACARTRERFSRRTAPLATDERLSEAWRDVRNGLLRRALRRSPRRPDR